MPQPSLIVIHPFAPVCNEYARVLVLGTFPSVRSRQAGFYYGHPRNRFWQVLAAVFGGPVPASLQAKQALLLEHGVALWDVLASCEIVGSADGSIRNPVPNDVAGLLARAPIRQVLANGQTAAALYRRFCEADTGRPILALPSTSPANAACSLAQLMDAWRPQLLACASEQAAHHGAPEL